MSSLKCLSSAAAVLLAALIVAGCDASSTSAPDHLSAGIGHDGRAVLMQEGTVYSFADLSAVPDARLSLLRRPGGLQFTLRTTDLPPGDAFTIWWVVFNFPEHCENSIPDMMECSEPDLFNDDAGASVLFAAGNVVGASGKGHFAASLNEGDLSGCQPPFGTLGLCRDGLVNPEGAEVHFVVRSHGPLVPGLVSTQISTFAGGCTAGTSFGAGDGPNECADLQFGIVLAP